MAVAALMFWGSGSESIKPPFEIGVINPKDHIKGAASSSVVIMEYSDFQCPACRAYYLVVREVMAEFGSQVALVYRHFPLINIHPNAELAARAAEAAGQQGKFWEMHDLLFEKQNEWSGVANIAPLFESYATLLDISVEQFKTDFVSNDVKALVRAEREHSIKSRLQGTPTFFINGKQIQNPASVLEFKDIVRKALTGEPF